MLRGLLQRNRWATLTQDLVKGDFCSLDLDDGKHTQSCEPVSVYGFEARGVEVGLAQQLAAIHWVRCGRS